jgi:hypothetical protein
VIRQPTKIGHVCKIILGSVNYYDYITAWVRDTPTVVTNHSLELIGQDNYHSINSRKLVHEETLRVRQGRDRSDSVGHQLQKLSSVLPAGSGPHNY